MPRRNPTPLPITPEIVDVLGQEPRAAAVYTDQVLLVELENPEAVRSFEPDWKKIATLQQVDLN